MTCNIYLSRLAFYVILASPAQSMFANIWNIYVVSLPKNLIQFLNNARESHHTQTSDTPESFEPHYPLQHQADTQTYQSRKIRWASPFSFYRFLLSPFVAYICMYMYRSAVDCCQNSRQLKNIWFRTWLSGSGKQLWMIAKRFQCQCTYETNFTNEINVQ